MTEWKKYEGTDEQIAEMENAEHGYLVMFNDKEIAGILRGDPEEIVLEDEYSYLICNPHPLADMISQQAQTGQPVWVKVFTSKSLIDDSPLIYKTTKPNWNIAGAEYRFTPFKD